MQNGPFLRKGAYLSPCNLFLSQNVHLNFESRIQTQVSIEILHDCWFWRYLRCVYNTKSPPNLSMFIKCPFQSPIPQFGASFGRKGFSLTRKKKEMKMFTSTTLIEPIYHISYIYQYRSHCTEDVSIFSPIQSYTCNEG